MIARVVCLLLFCAGAAQACEPDSLQAQTVAVGEVELGQHSGSGAYQYGQPWRFVLECKAGAEIDTLEAITRTMHCRPDEPDPESALEDAADAWRGNWLVGKQEEHSKLGRQIDNLGDALRNDISDPMGAFMDSCLTVGSGITRGEVQGAWRWAWATHFPRGVFADPAVADSLGLYFAVDVLPFSSGVEWVDAVIQYVERHQ